MNDKVVIGAFNDRWDAVVGPGEQYASRKQVRIIFDLENTEKLDDLITDDSIPTYAVVGKNGIQLLYQDILNLLDNDFFYAHLVAVEV